MAYQSIDTLQNALANTTFKGTQAPKKASGRALGTLVEIITFYLLKTWGLNNQISIERGLQEYGNSEINHMVEYSLHPITNHGQVNVSPTQKGNISSNKIFKCINFQTIDKNIFYTTRNHLLKNNILRNACTIASSDNSFLMASISKKTQSNSFEIDIYEQKRKSFGIFECKRVGVEEGQKKGPQTIEKAKQGAYVAKSTSSLQKVRNEAGDLHAIIYKSDGSYVLEPYKDLIKKVIKQNDKELLRRFILTVGVVSNHGNWFTSQNMNKEMKVLAQSYDWLLFLNDDGLCQFISDLLLKPKKKYSFVKQAFESSYGAGLSNQFTKVKMNLDADRALLEYFNTNLAEIEKWFEIITPQHHVLSDLKCDLNNLNLKNWENILA